MQTTIDSFTLLIRLLYGIDLEWTDVLLVMVPALKSVAGIGGTPLATDSKDCQGYASGRKPSARKSSIGLTESWTGYEVELRLPATSLSARFRSDIEMARGVAPSNHRNCRASVPKARVEK